MDSENWEIPEIMKDDTSALSLLEVFNIMKKRNKFFDNLKKNHRKFSSKNSIFEKVYEYVQRFCLNKNQENKHPKLFFREFFLKEELNQEDYIKIEIFFTKILDLGLKDLEETITLIPGIEKNLKYKGIKNLIKYQY